MHSLRLIERLTELTDGRPDWMHGTSPPACASETIDGDGHRTHLLYSGALCQRVLADGQNFAVSPLAANVRKLGERLGLAVENSAAFLEDNPIQLSGDAHSARRREFLRAYSLTLRRLAPTLEEIAHEHFAQLCLQPPQRLSQDVVEPYIDSVVRRAIAATDGHFGPAYRALTDDTATLFEPIHHPRRIQRKSREIGDFLGTDRTTPETTPEDNIRLSYVLQGREPMVSALTGYLKCVLRSNETERMRLLSGIPTTELFRLAAPVNYISRLASSDVQLGELRIARGDSVILMLPWASAGTGGGNRSMAFGSGNHSCAGQALALAITTPFLIALREIFARIDWTRLANVAAVPGVFRHYGDQ